MNIFKKLFCLHQWKTHAKEKYEWTESRVSPDTKHWTNPIVEPQQYSEINEVLICEKCGEIKQITY